MKKLTLEPISSILNTKYQSNWLVENFIEKKSLCMIFGEPSTCKSFMAMELAYCIGFGIDWYGNPVSKGEVIYIAGEGASGMQKRFEALTVKYGSSPHGIYVSSKPVEMINPNSVQEVLGIIKQLGIKPSLIIIDTLHRNFGEGDENSSRDVGVFVKHMDELKNATDAAILVIHHSGHGEKAHSRGSSAIRASLDSEYQLKATSGGIELVCRKMKEFDKPEIMGFELKPIQVNTASGTVDSAYLELACNGKQTQQNRDQQLLNTLIDTAGSKGIAVPATLLQTNPVLSGKPCITLDDLRQAFYSRVQSELPKQSSRQSTFNRCKKALIKDGVILEHEGHIIAL